MTETGDRGDVLEHPIGADGEFVLRIPSGRADVRAVDGDVVTVRELDGRDLEEHFIVDRGRGRLALRPREGVTLDLDFRDTGRGAARLAVDLPRAARASIETASGEIRAEGLTGEQRYRTASGDIELSRVAGVLGIDAVSGSVRVDATGEAELSGRLVSGDLRFDGVALRTVALATTSGDLELLAPLEGPGPFSVQTVSGDVEVVAGAGGIRVEARTVTGQLSSDLPHRSESRRGDRSIVVGEGRAQLSFKSISGDLRVAAGRASGEVASHASPEPPAPPPAPLPPAPAASSGFDGDPRLVVLRDLEAGAIDVETATRRLAEIEAATDA